MAVERKLIREHKKKVMVREFLHKETERAGFGGVEIQRTPMGTRISLVAERPGFVIGRRGATIKKLTDDLHDRYQLDNPQIEVQEDPNPALNSQIMAQKLAEALERGWHFRRAGHSTLRRIMESGARGCLIKISGKLTGGRSRSEKFKDGHIKYCGDTALRYMHRGYAVAKKKLGVIGVSVWIMDRNARLPDEIEVATLSPAGTLVFAKGPRATPRGAPTPTAAAPAAPAAASPRPAAPAPAPVSAAPAATPDLAAKRLEGRLTDVAGVGKAKAEALTGAGYGDIAALDKASEEDLAQIEGIGPKLAKKIKDELKRKHIGED
ncbi:MAG: 30S ribosomal protein S3 [Thermoplasmatota archaeon]